MKHTRATFVLILLACVLLSLCLAGCGHLDPGRRAGVIEVDAVGRVVIRDVTVTQAEGATVPAIAITIGSADDADLRDTAQSGAELQGADLDADADVHDITAEGVPGLTL